MRTFFCISLLLAAASACSPSFQADLQEIEITQRGVQVAPVDITRLWQADHTVIELQIARQLPAQDWTLDLTLSLSGKSVHLM